MQNSLSKCLIIIFVLFLLTFLMCSGPKTEEDQIRELMKEAGQHIEKKNISSLMGLLSDDYADTGGGTKARQRTWFRPISASSEGLSSMC